MDSALRRPIDISFVPSAITVDDENLVNQSAIAYEFHAGRNLLSLVKTSDEADLNRLRSCLHRVIDAHCVAEVGKLTDRSGGTR